MEIINRFKVKRKDKGYRHYAKVKCHCGNIFECQLYNIKSGNTKSCGCSRKVHGLSNQDLYHIWEAIIQRCLNNKTPSYKSYGGRGISICDQWRSNPKDFIEWCTDNGYKKGLSIDRIDVNGNYEPENCRFITHSDQMRNTTRNKRITFNGVTRCLSEWSRELGIKPTTLGYRINQGWDLEKAFSTI